MELKELKKEVESLPEIKEILNGFKKNWIRSLHDKKHQYSMLEKITPEKTKQINYHLKEINRRIELIQEISSIKARLNTYARYLVELKLTSLNGDINKSKIITNSIIYDDFLNLKNTIGDHLEIECRITSLVNSYHKALELFNQELSLEDYLQLMDLEHKKHINNLQKLQLKQKKLLHILGSKLLESSKSALKHF